MRFTLLAGLVASGSVPRNRVVGGHQVLPIDKYPFILSLAVLGRHLCGGVAYKSNVLLTSAHCTIYDMEEWRVRFRYFNHPAVPDEDFGFRVTERRAHPEFDHGMFDVNDVALWKIDGTFDLNPDEYVQIDKTGLSQTDGHLLTIAGWGKQANQNYLSNRLMEVELPTFDIDTCVEALATVEKVVNPKAMFCAGFPEGKKDACEGDSGGPIFTLNQTTPIIVGIISWGHRCAIPGYPGIFTRLDAYSEFLEAPF